MNYVALTPFFAAGLPTGIAVVRDARVQAYVASDNRHLSMMRHTLDLTEQLAQHEDVMLWSRQQLEMLSRLKGQPIEGRFIFLQDQLSTLGLPTFSPAYTCAQLNLNEPGDDALSQAFALLLIHRYITGQPLLGLTG